MRTKWAILEARREAAQAEVDKITRQLVGLIGTECGLKCDGCGKELRTEADFAKHFVIPDERYLNLGNCPDGPNANKTFA